MTDPIYVLLTAPAAAVTSTGAGYKMVRQLLLSLLLLVWSGLWRAAQLWWWAYRDLKKRHRRAEKR